MSAQRSSRGPIVVVGVSHKTAPVEVREQFSTGKDVLPEMLGRLAARGAFAEVVFLSTCNRVEVFATPVDGQVETAARGVREALAAHVGAPSPAALDGYLYEHSGDEAVRHIFRVASSLESMVLGEPQILGQVKEAVDAASAAGTLGSFLGRCMTRAFGVAKRVRTETALGSGTVSISSVAVDLARHIFGDLEGRTVLLVGAGEMAEQAAKSLGKDAHAIRVCNRSFDRAAELAAGFGGTAAPLDKLEDELALADVVVASTAARDYVITRDMVKRAMKHRKGRTLFFVDIAVPRNVEPSVHGIDGVYVYNVDDLEAEVAQGMRARQGEVTVAEKLVEGELGEWHAWARGLDVQPTVVALRTKARGVLLGELERTLTGKLRHLGELERAALTQMMESATNKLLHAPTAGLKDAAARGDAVELAQALAALFDLTPEAAAPSIPAKAAGSAAPPASRNEDDDDRTGLPH